MSDAHSALPTPLGSERPAARLHFAFFPAMAVVMLAIVVLGFSRTFFLSTFFGTQPMPAYLHAHGVILTGWYSWFAVQTFAVLAGRTDLHRRLGIVGAILGLAVILVSTLTVLRLGPRVAELGIEVGPRLLAEINWIDFGSLVSFAAFLGLAMLLRRRSQIHKRLMLLASLSILGPAILRIVAWPVWGAWEDRYLPLIGVLVVLLVALAIHDLKSNRAVHPATLAGGFVILAFLLLGAYVLPDTEFGKSFVSRLEDPAS